MGLKIFISAMNLHTRRLPMAVSSGLSGSQSATKPSALSTSVRLTWSHSATKPSAPSASARFTTPRRATKPLAPRARARVTWSRSATKLGRRSMVTNLLWANRPLLSHVWNERRCRWESPSALKNRIGTSFNLGAGTEKTKKGGPPISENRTPSYFQKMQHIRFPRGCLFSRKSRALCREYLLAEWSYSPTAL